MFKKIILSIFLAAVFGFTLNANTKQPDTTANKEHNYKISMNNRVLANVNGRTISVMDLVKRLDLIMQNQFPEHANSVIARYQFYQEYWPFILQEMGNNYLVLADADDKQLPVNNGEIRQEIETSFGSNPIQKINDIGWTYQEARQMMKENITIKRMMYVNADMKAFTKVTPQKIKNAYNEFIKKNPAGNITKYQTIAFKCEDEGKAEKLAKKAHKILTKDGMENISEKLGKNENVTVTLSDEYVRKDDEMSAVHKKVLDTLEPNSYSKPIKQTSKDKSTVLRIFCLKERQNQTPPSFEKMEVQMTNRLLSVEIAKEKEKYLGRLHKQYQISKNYLSEKIPANFQPFVLQ